MYAGLKWLAEVLSGFRTIYHKGHAEGGDTEAIWICRALPLRSTDWPGLLTHRSWRLRKGLWLGLTGQPYRDIKKTGEGHGVGGVKEDGYVGEAAAQPGAHRLAWKRICWGGWAQTELSSSCSTSCVCFLFSKMRLSSSAKEQGPAGTPLLFCLRST